MRILPDKKHLLPGIVALVWIPATCLGVWAFASREYVPAPAGTPDLAWPAETTLPPRTFDYALVVALHPECPCSLATLEELDGIMAQSRGRLQAVLLCVDYPGLAQPVHESRAWRRAVRIPGLALTRDPGGEEARRFAARTSGEVRLYGRAGELLFHGGITASRGHVGDNPGATAVLDIVLGRAGKQTPRSTAVFGCTL